MQEIIKEKLKEAISSIIPVTIIMLIIITTMITQKKTINHHNQITNKHNILQTEIVIIIIQLHLEQVIMLSYIQQVH